LEELFSGWSIEKYAREHVRVAAGTPLWDLTEGKGEAISCRAIGEAAGLGDNVALGIVEEIARYVGLAIANGITLVHPEVFVLGGGVSLMGDVLLEPIRGMVDELAYGAYGGGTRLVGAELGEDVVIVGGLLLAG
jgi:glucokinase